MKKNKFGFTLIEVIIAIAMVAVLAVASIPMMGSYYRSSNMMQLNDTAKSIFLSMQSYLTNEKSAGLLEEAVSGAAPVPDKSKLVFDSSVDFNGTTPDTAGELSYFALSKGDTVNYTDQKLGQILDRYISDKTILQNTIVVEFNPKTGRVFSAQYSEKATEFSYTDSTINNTDPFGNINILNRKQDHRDNTRVGYYGMGSNVSDPATKELGEYEVELVNENRLYLRWSDAEPDGNTLPMEINYTINIMDSDNGTLLRSVVVPSEKVEQLTIGKLTTEGLNNSQIQLSTTIGDTTAEQEYFVYYQLGDENKIWYYLVLDNIDNSGDEKFSIVERYPELAMKNIKCSVKASAKGHKSKTAMSNYEHSMLESVDVSGDTSKYKVEYARHLNNLRDAQVNDSSKKGTILQTADIDWQKTVDDGYVLCDSSTILDTHAVAADQTKGGAFRSISFKAGEGTSTFTNALVVPYDGAGKFIKDITILPDTTADSAGLFAKNNAKIERVKLYNATLQSTGDNVGLLVGENSSEGQLAGIEANGTVVGRDYVGGIVGKDGGKGGSNLNLLNTSRDTKVNGVVVKAVTSEVNGEKYVGGIAGESSNTIDSGYTACNNYGIIIGTDAVGGIVGANKQNNAISACENGGIAKIKDSADPDLGFGFNVGGIAGINEGIISSSRSILLNGIDLSQRPTVKYAKESSRTGIRGENAGGIAGSNSGTVKDCTANGWVVGTSNVGGVVGLNQRSGTIENCNQLDDMNSQNMRGEVFATGDNVGGIVGKIESSDGGNVRLENFVNISDVYGKKYVGGIVGSNGIEGDTYTQNKLVIDKCQNKGFVGAFTAYAGGITGCNTGDILHCSTEMPKDTQQDIDRRGKIELLGEADYVGGFAGYNNGMIASETSDISNNYSTNVSGSVKGKNFVGGIVGHNDTEGVINFIKVVDAKVEATGNFVGGFIGLNTSLKTKTGTDGVSGLAFNAAPRSVKGKNFVGGVIGANLVDNAEGQLNIIANTEKPDKKVGLVEGKGFVGGIIGYNGIIQKGNDETLKESLEKELKKLNKIDPFKYVDDSSKLVGKTTSIQLSTNNLDVKAERYIGGIIGYNTQASDLAINDCVNGGAISCDTKVVTDHYFIGGITGRNSGLIKGSSNNGDIDSKSKYTGGIVEINEGQIIDCKSSGTTRSTKGNIGGIVGLNGLLSDDESTEGALETDLNKIYMQGCTSETTGKVIANGDDTHNVGGLVGVNRAKIEGGTSSGSVTASKGDYVGGIAGKNTGKGLITNVTVKLGTVATQKITGKDHVGGFVGLNEEEATFSNSALESGNIEGANYVGGFVGSNTAEGQRIEGLKNTDKVTVEGVRNVGGIVGRHEGNEIKNCVNLAKVIATGTDATAYAGGITGENAKDKIIENCDNSGEIISNGEYVGGIVAVNNGKLINCRALGGSIEGRRSAGGLLGRNSSTGTLEYSGEVAVENPKVLKTNVKSISDGKEETRVGGLFAKNENKEMVIIEGYIIEADVSHVKRDSSSVGIYVGGIVPVLENYQTIKDCDLKGSVTVDNGSTSESDGTGGIVGKNLGIVTNINLANEKPAEGKTLSVKGTMNVGGIVGKNAGVIEACSNGTEKTKDVLIVQGSKNVGGIIGVNVKEGTSTELTSIEKWNNYATVKGTDNVGGLLGYTRQNIITISGCVNYGEIEGIGISGSGAAVGGIVGRFQPVLGTDVDKDIAKIENCENKGEIKSKVPSTGGIVGYIQRTTAGDVVHETKAVINECKNSAEISSSAVRVGGIAGTAHNNADILKTVNAGVVISTVSGNASAAGIVGYFDNSARISNCINNADIKAVNGSHVGGIAGNAMGTVGKKYIIKSYSTEKATITGKDRVAGIMGGVNTNTIIEECTNKSKLHNYGNSTGGIVGYLQGDESEINNCTNGEENDSTVLILKSGAYSGGIVGHMSSNAKVEDCINYSDITEPVGAQVGGIAGKIEGTSSVIGSENYGTITQDSNQIGGIVGLSAGTNPIESCTNKPEGGGSVSGSKEVGGILGLSVSKVTVNQCINKADKVYASASDYAIVGGLIGEMRNNSVLCNSRNYSKVYATNAGNAVGGAVGHMTSNSAMKVESVVNYGEVSGSRDIGGMVGKVTQANKSAEILKSINYGKVERVTERTHKEGRVGGIVGHLSDGSNMSVNTCVNFGDVVISDEASDVGGIVGLSTNWNTLIIDCINAAPVYAPQSSDVGGIIGYNASKVTSCKTVEVDLEKSDNMSANGMESESIYDKLLEVAVLLKPKDYKSTASRKNTYDEEGFLIVGKDNVGGIVGNNQSKNEAVTIAILSSGNTRDPIDITKNVFNVKGENNVGGVAGLNVGANILGCYNQAVVKKTKNDNSKNVGGIVGKIGDTKNSISSIKGCFNVGDLTESSNTYIGGLIGYRVQKGINENPAIGGASRIYDSFTTKDKIPQTTVKELTGNWLVGNEPYGSDGYQGMPNDAPKTGDGKNVEPNLLSDDFIDDYNNRVEKANSATPAPDPLYEKITRDKLEKAISDSNAGNPSDLKVILDNFIKLYPFNIDAPEITSVTRNNNDKDFAKNSFTVEWRAVQANIDKYVLTFYDAAKLNEDETNAGKTDTLGGTKLDKEHLKTGVSFSNKNDVGKTFYVGIKATSEVKGEPDSDETYFEKDGKIQKFRILPWLPTPEIKEELKEGTTYSFDVSNFDKYSTEGEPKKDFPAIEKNGLTSEIYNSYMGDHGVDKIVLTIKDGNTVKGTYTYVLNEDGSGFIPENGWDGTYEFVLGQTEAKKTFNLEAVAYPKDLDYTEDGLENGYTASVIKKWTLEVEQTFKLETPDVKVVYSGGTTKESTEYTINWANVTNASSYELEIVDAGGNVVVSKVAATSPYKYKVPEEYWGKDLTVKVVAKGNKPYTDSDPGEATLPAIKDTNPPDIKISPSYMEPKYTIDWSGYADGAYPPGTKFDVEISFSEPGYEDYHKKLTNTGDTKFEVDLDGVDIPANVDLIVKVKAYGIKGSTYDSEIGTKSETVYKRLPSVKVESNKRVPGELKYDVEWNIPSGITAENCSGYTIYRKLTDGTIEKLATVEDPTVTKAQVEFKEADVGKTVEVWMVAIGKEKVSSSSLAEKSANIVVPKRLNAPTNLSVIPAKPDEGAAALSADAFVKAVYTASWTKPTQESGANHAGYEVNVVTTDGTAIYEKTINNANTLSDAIKGIEAKYAGQTVKVKVRSISTVSLESDWVEMELTLPKVKLETPTGFKYDEATKKLTVNTVDYAASYEFSIKIGTADATQHDVAVAADGTVSFEVVDDMLKSGFTATVKAKGDGTHYVDSDTAKETVQVLGMPTELKFDSENKKFTWTAVTGTTKYIVEVRNIGDKPTDKPTTHEVTVEAGKTPEFALGNMIGVDVRVKAVKPDTAPTDTIVHDSIFTEWVSSGSALTVKKEERTVTVEGKDEEKTYLSFALPVSPNKDGEHYDYKASAILGGLEDSSIKLETATVTISPAKDSEGKQIPQFAQFEFELAEASKDLKVAYIKMVGTSGKDTTLKLETSFIAGINLEGVTDATPVVIITETEENLGKLKEKFDELEKAESAALEIPQDQTKKDEIDRDEGIKDENNTETIVPEVPEVDEVKPEQNEPPKESIEPQPDDVVDEPTIEGDSPEESPEGLALLNDYGVKNSGNFDAIRQRAVEMYVQICNKLLGIEAA